MEQKGRCIVCAMPMEKMLVDEKGEPLCMSDVMTFFRESSLYERRLTCNVCCRVCFANERERVPGSRKGRCSDCGGNHMSGVIERTWLDRAVYKLVCRDHF